MKNKTVLWLAAGALVGILTFGATLAYDYARAPKVPADGAADWSAALAHLEKNDPKSAAAALTAWIKKAEEAGVHSPEAHFNLAIARWDLKEAGPAASALLKSLLIAQSLPHIARAQAALAGMQRELGVSDAVAKETRFLARVCITDNGLTCLMMIAFWMIAGISLWIWKERDHLKFRQALAWTLPIVAILVFCGIGLVSRDWNGGYAVLNSEESAIAVFPNPKLDTQEKLLDLPAGTLVHSSGESQNGFVRIDSPIVAWVQQAQIEVPTTL